MYLLDEILQGTNSLERAAAVRIVLRHLLATPAIGAITTHDLALTETSELRESGQHVHLRETIHEVAAGFRMTFDYRLHPGVATSRNALALLRLVGLSATKEPTRTT
jgi:DNA mismatch repair ATPase MutS